jgi:hypothetical protein
MGFGLAGMLVLRPRDGVRGSSTTGDGLRYRYAVLWARLDRADPGKS